MGGDDLDLSLPEPARAAKREGDPTRTGKLASTGGARVGGGVSKWGVLLVARFGFFGA